MSKPVFDEAYFRKYVGSGTHYRRVYRDYSSIDQCIRLFEMKSAPRIRRVAVLGAATGEVLKDFYQRLGIRPIGCEISEWAHSKIHPNYRKRIAREDLRSYVKRLPQVDLIFTNALMYLEPKEIRPLLKFLRTKTRFIHYEGSYQGAACPDRHRRAYETRAWWRAQFEGAGFRELRTVWGLHTYLWEKE